MKSCSVSDYVCHLSLNVSNIHSCYSMLHHLVYLHCCIIIHFMSISPCIYPLIPCSWAFRLFPVWSSKELCWYKHYCICLQGKLEFASIHKAGNHLWVFMCFSLIYTANSGSLWCFILIIKTENFLDFIWGQKSQA